MFLALAASSASATSTAEVFLTGPDFRSELETLPAGFTSAELGGGGMVGAGSFSYLGSAYADTASGTLGAAATATGSGYDVSSDRIVLHSRAQFVDELSFSSDGQVTLRLAVQGSFASVVGGQMTSDARLTTNVTTESASSFWRGGSTFFNVSTTEQIISNLPSNYIVWIESTFSPIVGIPVPVAAFLEVFVAPPTTGTASALFGNTAELMVFTQPGVTFTSRSGNFLVGHVPIAAPAPGSWPMALVPALALLLARRRRAARATPR